MGFLIRSAFWLSLVLLVIPVDGGQATGEQGVGAIEAAMAAREAVGDIGQMCERRPEVCVTGRAALHTIGVRARESARIAYEMLDGAMAEAPDAISTGTVPAGQ